jgi:putative ABC transport system permease protein
LWITARNLNHTSKFFNFISFTEDQHVAQRTSLQTAMLYNYLKVSVRNFLKKRVYSAINVIGLSVGAAAALLIFLHVQYEYSFDKFIPGHENIYRMVEDRIYPDRRAYFTLIPAGFSLILPDEIPEVESTVRTFGTGAFNTVVRVGENTFSETYYIWADSTFFDVFPFKLLKGNKEKALRVSQTSILTESTARRLFGNADPIGKTITIGDQDHEVVGIMEDLPDNSHMKISALMPALDIDFLREPSYYVASSYTYLKLAPGTNPETVHQKMPGLVDKYAAGQIERELGVAYDKYIAAGNGYRYTLQSIANIHLESNRLNELRANGNLVTVRVLALVGILILVIAGINFVNLATARSAERAREVGVRKVLGSARKQLIAQFLSESFMMSVLSMSLALILLQILLGEFNEISQSNLQFDIIDNTSLMVAVICVTVAMGGLAGLYPAFYISQLKPVQVLKGKFHGSQRGTRLRNGLVLFQFTISVVLISATLTGYKQLRFLGAKTLGFDKENLLVIRHNSRSDTPDGIQAQLRQVRGVRNVGAGNSVPGGYFYGIPFRTQGSNEIFTPKVTDIDDYYAEALDLKLVAGRFFSPEFNDSLSLMINERAASSLGLQNPVGSTLTQNINPDTTISYTIIGIVKDFNFESLHSAIAPLVIMSAESDRGFQGTILVRLEKGNVAETMERIENVWKQIVPGAPFDYYFLDENLDTLYASESRSGELMLMFTIIAIVIACVGLFGLSAYTAHQRTKEIGVRKVLGASFGSILSLLSRDFVKLVVISMLLGCPVAWFLLTAWLESFAYRVPLGPSTFALAGVIVIAFTAVTASYQAIKSSLANPVNSLKEE